MADKETPQSLLEFFTVMAPDEEDGEECSLHYGCACVLEKGLEASRMLVAIQKVVGAEADAPGKESSRDDSEIQARIDALSEAESEVDRLLMETIGLKRERDSSTEEIERLKEKIRSLYRQIERLYSKSELTAVLGQLRDNEAAEQRGAKEAAEARERKSQAPGKAGQEEEEPEVETVTAAEAGESPEEGLSGDTGGDTGKEEGEDTDEDAGSDEEDQPAGASASAQGEEDGETGQDEKQR